MITKPQQAVEEILTDYHKARQQELNENAAARAALEEKYGQVWSTDQIREDFEVLGFMAPLVVVQNKVTGKKGSLEFQHSPRFYFSYTEHKP